VVDKMEAGDHSVYLGEVVAAGLERPANILTDLDTTMDYGGDSHPIRFQAKGFYATRAGGLGGRRGGRFAERP